MTHDALLSLTPGEALTADLLREVIRTPAARELLAHIARRPTTLDGARTTRGVGEPRSGAERSAQHVAALLGEDPELGLRALTLVPGVVDAGLGALVALGQLLQEVPPPLAVEVLDSLLHQLDHEAWQQAGQIWGGLVRQLLRDPQLGRWLARMFAGVANSRLRAQLDRLDDEALVPLAELALELCRELDFGLLREATAVATAASQRALLRLIDHAATDPVLLSNLVALLPSLSNLALVLGARVLGAIRLPPEVLASALFHLMESLDIGALADLVSSAARLLSQVHEGNLVLGRHESRLRQVLAQVAGQLVRRLDRTSIRAGLGAVAEDLATLLLATGDVLYGDPELLGIALAAALDGLAGCARGLGGAMARLKHLSDDDLAVATAALEHASPGGLVARLCNSLVQGGRLLLHARPDLARDLAATFHDAIDRSSLRALWLELGGPDSTRAGELLARGLAALCSLLAHHPQTIHAAVANLDRPQARADLRATLDQLTAALARHPALLATLTTPLLTLARRQALDYVRALPRRLTRRTIP